MKQWYFFVLTAFLLVAGPLFLQGQPLTIQHSCSFGGEETGEDFYGFDASQEASRIVNDILNHVSLAKNFIVKSSDCKNALATEIGRDRYILYNTTFLEDFKKDARTKWAAYCVMAHEIGHHLNHHNFAEKDPKKRRQMEVEADYFAGGVLYMMGADLNEAQAGVQTFSLDGETTTHPSKKLRLEAIASAWKKQEEKHPREAATQPGSNTPQEQAVKVPPVKQKETVPSDSGIPQNQPSIQPNNDLAIAQRLVGRWSANYWLNGMPANVTRDVYADGSGYFFMYTNGYLTNTQTVNWRIYNGYYLETTSLGFNYKAHLRWNPDMSLTITLMETNDMNTAPGNSLTFLKIL